MVLEDVTHNKRTSEITTSTPFFAIPDINPQMMFAANDDPS